MILIASGGIYVKARIEKQRNEKVCYSMINFEKVLELMIIFNKIEQLCDSFRKYDKAQKGMLKAERVCTRL